MKLVRCLRLFLHGWFCNLLPFILDRTGMIHLEKVKLASQSSALCKVICSFPQKTITSIRTAQGKTLELVTSYKYLLIIDEGFGVHLQTKGEARFLLEKQAIFLLQSSKASDFWLVFLPVLEAGDVVYLCVSPGCLQSLTLVCHCARRFISDCSCLSHLYLHLYSVNWKPLCITIKWHFVLFCSSCSFSFFALSAWNTLQSEPKLSQLVPLEAFGSVLRNRQQKSFEQCLCFKV